LFLILCKESEFEVEKPFIKHSRMKKETETKPNDELYVAVDGSDSNDCLSLTQACFNYF
jgi:hypothetical protein